MNRLKIEPAFRLNNVPIIAEFDNFYAPYAGVCIQSIIESANESNNYDIIIISHDISDSNQFLLKSLGKELRNISIRILDIHQLRESLSTNFSKELLSPKNDLWVRNLSPYLFECYERVIVVDLDMLVQHDLAELMAISMGDFCLAGVRDLIWCGQIVENFPLQKHGESFNITMHEYLKTFVPIEKPMDYYNAGLTVWDCINCRKQVDEFSVIKSLLNERLFLGHQDAINLVFDGRIKFIETKWNYQVQVNERYARRMSYAPEEYKNEYILGKKNPYVIHWLGNPKPYVCPDVELGYLWWETAKRTPFIPHIFARMFDELTKRQDYYEKRYGTKVNTWDPAPKNINRE